MSQEWGGSRNLQNAKAIDFAFVIAGWPTIYTVSKSYSLPSFGALSTGNDFDAVTIACTSNLGLPVSATVGRPEEGATESARLDIELFDTFSGGRREVTDLCSRAYYGDDLTSRPTLVNDVTSSETLIQVSSLDGFSLTSGFAFIGPECIKYSRAYPDGSSCWLEECTRGRRLTTASPHLAGAAVYPKMPNLEWRRALLFKGYQALSIDNWVRTFGGSVGRVERLGGTVRISVHDTLSLTRRNSDAAVVGGSRRDGSAAIFQPAILGDFEHPTYFDYLSHPEVKLIADDASGIANGHRLLNIAGTWLGITELAL